MTKLRKKTDLFFVIIQKPLEYIYSGGLFMPKISATDSKGLLAKYIIKIVCTSILSITLLSSITSFILLKLDLNLSSIGVISIVITIISAVIVSSISITQFKNNLLMLSCISVTPLAIFVFINYLVNDTGSIILIVKLIGIFIAAIVISFIKSARKR